MLDNMDEATALAKSGQPLDNLAWAISGNFITKRGTKWYKHGIHGSEYVDGVYKGLIKIVDDGLENGLPGRKSHLGCGNSWKSGVVCSSAANISGTRQSK